MRSGRLCTGLYCAEGEPRPAESALAIQKAMPTGGHFNESFGITGTCEGAGYTIAAGADPCTPAVVVHFKTESNEGRYQTASQRHLDAFRAQWGLTQPVAQLMTQCTCAPGSPFYAKARGQCASGLSQFTGAWVHRDPYNGHTLMCDEGPFVFATRALSVLKSSPQLPMHYRDQIAPVSCTQLGFPLRYPPVDHCYTHSDSLALHIYTRTNINTDAGIKESEWTETNMTTGGFVQFAR